MSRGRALMCVMAAMALLCAAPAVEAQDTLSVAARLVMRQPTGIVLRLNAGNELVTGMLEQVTPESVVLSGPARVVPLASVTDAWLQRRSTRRGGKVGAIIGAPTGAVIFGLGAAVLSGLCEYDCNDFGAGGVLLATLIGGAAGGAAGYITGAIIGSTVPRWERLTESSAPPTIVARPAQRNPGLSAFNVTPVAARAAQGGDGVGAGVSVAYLSQLSVHFGLGAEFGSYDLKLEPLTYEFPCGAETCTNTIDTEGTWGAAGLARIGAGADRRVEPYALLGLGVYNFGRGTTLGGYSAGPGLRVRIGDRFAVSGEARWHSNFTNSGDDSQLGFYTAGVAVSVLR